MNRLLPFLFLLLIVSCKSNSASGISSGQNDTTKLIENIAGPGHSEGKSLEPGLNSFAGVPIDTIRIPEKAVPARCYIQDLSEYPAFTGFKNKKFERLINYQIASEIKGFLKQSLYQSQCDPGQIKDPTVVNGNASANFEILNYDSKYASILMRMWNTYGGGNAWTPYYKVINIDLVHNKQMFSKDLVKAKLDIPLINKRIRYYFDTMFADDAKVSPLTYPLLDSSTKLKKLEYGIRKDSLLLILHACPSAHYSDAIYTIPISIML